MIGAIFVPIFTNARQLNQKHKKTFETGCKKPHFSVLSERKKNSPERQKTNGGIQNDENRIRDRLLQKLHLLSE